MTRESIRRRGYPPSLQEIGASADLTSTSSGIPPVG
ncbi:hypothetical protein ACFQ7F_16205 [Streptomyces sp. NPDC056486]